MLKFMQLVWSE